ncbi:MAG: orotidine-5'-phosphate decarboxylase [Candidatus Omnitrophica bacterium]|nr:orotidine-5'-phosphate decarboxylase [Candidatus Omnitrophota bacterium]
MKPSERLIVALDVQGPEEALGLVKTLVPAGVSRFKVGLELFTSCGSSVLEGIRRAGGEVFLDLKLHDIPNTVARAAAAATRLGVWMMNLHIQGGSSMMRQALISVREEAKKRRIQPPLLVGVTVLTSMAEKDLMDLGLRKTLKDQVLDLAKLAKSVGLDGIVASPREAKVIRWACGEGFLIVTPGIRPKESTEDDQQRTATPSEAIQAGADYIVVGRPIISNADPAGAAKAILTEISPCDPVK